MKEIVLSTVALSKIYGNKAAVDHVNMHVKQGDIYGFIGENGSGKTTLIRMVTGLVFPTNGEISLFRNSSKQSLEASHKRIGSIVETPAFFANMTAEQNLEYYRIQRGIPDKNCVMRVLKMVNLTETDNKKFKQFSLGMKQRLGLALAIMANPDFLILDEPINGLDPMGIIEFRELIKTLNQQYGMTVFISSHILTELAQIATTFGIIHHGKLVKEFSKEQLDAETKQALCVKVNDTSTAVTVLEQILHINQYEVMPNNEIYIYDMLDNPSEINFQLSSNGVRVESATQVGTSLENYFLQSIGYTAGGKNHE